MGYKLGDDITGLGRNSKCPCDIGKKYKKCCINEPGKPFELFATWRPYHQFIKDSINKGNK